MRRHGNLFAKMVAPENLLLAFVRAKRGKSWQSAIKRVERDLEGNLERLRKSLVNKTFTTSPYRLKTIYEPKKRTIYRLPFYPDRIVQHALMNVVEPRWEALFIADSYACRRGKGLHATGSVVLINQLEKYQQEIPFLATVRKIERYFTLT